MRTNALPRAELLDAAQSFHAARTSLSAAARSAEATDPSDDVVDDAALSSSSSEDEQPDVPPAAPPPPPPPPRKRSRGASRSSAPPAPSPPPALTLDNAVGRRALVPARVWPKESCPEHKGKGWEVTINQVDRRLGAALVRFVTARDKRNRCFASEWLHFSSLKALP